MYALLLGSGISSAAQIPTGWEVVLDLTRKIAKLEGDDCEPDPVEWMKRKHNVEPDYSRLLDSIAKTSTERQQLLRGYFEATDEDKSAGFKTPTIAHKAIARIIAAGYIRIIVTTNFDRLLEQALNDAGVIPTMITTSDQIMGALPLAHAGVTIIKLHGDYLDTRIRNTVQELASYDAAFDQILDRVFDEYGLIICGWSAEWDVALRAALERCRSRRFTTFWSTRSLLKGNAKRLAEHRRAEVIEIKDANQFFGTLEEKIRSLSDMSGHHPLSSKIASTTLKRYLVDPGSKIRMRDLVHEETEKVVAHILGGEFSPHSSREPAVEINFRVPRYNAISEVLLSILVTGCYWGDANQSKLWADVIQRVARTAQLRDGYDYLNALRQYPALLLCYGGGLAAVCGENYHALAGLLLKPTVKSNDAKDVAFCCAIHGSSVMEKSVGWLINELSRRHTPVSDCLHATLRNSLKEYIPEDEAYDLVFDRFEYLFALVHADLTQWQVSQGWWGPIGRFGWRRRDFKEMRIMNVIKDEIESAGSNWAPLKAGLFAGSLERAKAAQTNFNVFLSTVSFF